MPVDITRDEVQRLVREGAQLVDVRPPAEFEEEHVAGAINIPQKTLAATIDPGVLERGRPVNV